MKTMESSRLLARAKGDVGKLSTRHDPGTDHGNLGCADAVTRILDEELRISLRKTLSTDVLYDELMSGGWQQVDLRMPGAVIVSPTKHSEWKQRKPEDIDQSHVDAIKGEADRQREQVSKPQQQ